MQRQAGISAVAAVAGVAVLAAAGAAFFAWQKTNEADRLRSELTRTRSDLDKARADMRKAAQEVASAGKEVSQMKVTTERLIAERDAVRASLETAQAAGEQLRGDLALVKDQVSYLSARAPKEVVRGMPKSPPVRTALPQQQPQPQQPR